MNIRKLPEEISSTIRSAVLIPSPSQAVVELVLNSIDAGATSIAVLVDLRVFKLQVDDNGQGIELGDLETIGGRYVTSKCYSLAELYSNCKYHGYRGEALASLCEVSGMLEIVSRPTRNRETYEKLFVHGKAQPAKVSSTSLQTSGTSITITDFMYNMPVRRKSMQEAVELERIKSHVEYISLSHPQVSFIVKNKAKMKLILHKHKNSNEISAFGSLFGQELLESLGAVHFTSDKFKISGYISKKPHRHRGIQLVYVNKRAFESSTIHDYVKVLLSKSSIIRNNGPWKNKPIPDHVPAERWLSFPSLEKRNRFSVFVIFIECAHSEYDISWDSKKPEIYFQDRDGILKCVGDAIKQFLERENLVQIEPEVEEASTKIPVPCLPSKPSLIENEDINDYATWDIQGAVHGVAMKRPNKPKHTVVPEITIEKEMENNKNDKGKNLVPETVHDILRNESSCSKIFSVPPIVKFVDKKSSNVNRLKITKGAYMIKMKEENKLRHTSNKLLKYKCPQKGKLLKSTNIKNPQPVTEKKTLKDRQTKIASKSEHCKGKDSVQPLSQNKEDTSSLHSVETLILAEKTESNCIPQQCCLLLENLNNRSAGSPACSSVLATFNTTNSCYKSADETPFIDETISSIVEEDNQPSDLQINPFNVQKSFRAENLSEVVEVNELIQHDTDMLRKQNKNEKSCAEKSVKDSRKTQNIHHTEKSAEINSEKQKEISLNSPGQAHFLTSFDFLSSAIGNERQNNNCVEVQSPDHEQLGPEVCILAPRNNTPVSLSPPKPKATVPTKRAYVLTASEFDEDIPYQGTNRTQLQILDQEEVAQHSGEVYKLYCNPPIKEKRSRQLQASETLVISIPTPQEGNLGKESRIIRDSNNSIPGSFERNGEYTNSPLLDHPIENINLLSNENQTVEDGHSDKHYGTEAYLSPYFSSDISSTVQHRRQIACSPLKHHECQVTDTHMDILSQDQSVKDGHSDKHCGTEAYSSPFFSSDISVAAQHRKQTENSPSKHHQLIDTHMDIPQKQNDNFLSAFEQKINAHNTTGKDFSIFSFQRLFGSGGEQVFQSHEPVKEKENSLLECYQNLQKNEASEDIFGKESGSTTGFAQSSKCTASVTLSSLSPLLQNSILSITSPLSVTSQEPSFEPDALSNSQKIVVQMRNLTFESPYFAKSPICSCKKKKCMPSEKETEHVTSKRRKLPSTCPKEPCQESSLIRNVPSSVGEKELGIFESRDENEAVDKEISVSPERVVGFASKAVENSAASKNSHNQYLSEVGEVIHNQTLSGNENTNTAEPVNRSDTVDNIRGINMKGKATTNALENSGWVKLQKSDGRPYYMHTSSGATSYCTPHTHEDEGTFTMSKRLEIIPKGMSPILVALAPSHCKPKFSPATRKMLQETYLKESSDDNLATVKWKNKPGIEKIGITDVLDVVKTSLQSKARYTAQLPDMMSFVSAKMTGKLLRYKYNKEIFTNLEVIAQFDNKFIIVLLNLDKDESPSIIGIFDQHAVHERIRLENLMKEYSEDETEWSFKSSKLSEPLVIDISPREHHIMSEFQEKFEKIGLRFSFANEGSVEITGVPTCLHARAGREQINGNTQWLNKNVKVLLQDQVHFLLRTGGHEPVLPDIIKDVINSEACKGAVKFGDPLSVDECRDMLSCLSQCDLPFQCAHGRPSFMPIFDTRLYSEEVNRYSEMNN